MKTFITFLKSLFESKYGSYSLVKEETVRVAIMKQVEDTEWSGGYGISDPMDVKSVPTGEFYNRLKQTWVAYHKKTNLPKYKHIYVD
jgi:hypothetical protein